MIKRKRLKSFMILASIFSLLCFMGACKDDPKDKFNQNYENSEIVLKPNLFLSETEAEIEIGKTLILEPTLKNFTAEVAWQSNDNSVATVANGVVTAVGVGETIITVSAQTGDINLSAECKITVIDYNKYPGIYTNYTSLTMAVNSQIGLTSEIRYQDEVYDGDFVYESDNNEIVKVDANGVITALQVGETKVHIYVDYLEYNLVKTIEVKVVEVSLDWDKLATEIVVPELQAEEIYAVEKMPTITPYLVKDYDGTVIDTELSVEYFVRNGEDWLALNETPCLPGEYKATYSYAGNEIYMATATDVPFSILDLKGGFGKLLKMETVEAVSLFESDWPTTYIPTLTENGVRTIVELVGDGGVCKTTINLKSVYQLKDFDYIKMSYYILADSNGWQLTSLCINGLDCKDLGYINDGQGNNLRTITITKAELEAIGLTEESYIENCSLVPYYNYGARTFCVAGIEFLQYSDEVNENIFNMDSQESVGLFTSDWPTTYIPTLTENGVRTIVELGGDGSVCKTTIDLKSLYQLKDISSITMSYYILADSNGWQLTSLYVNGVDCKDLGYINDEKGTNLRTITITKAELEAIGLTEESYIENCALVPYYNYGTRTFCIASIAFNEYKEVSPEETLNALLQMGSQESAGLFTSDWQSSPDYVPVWAEETGVTFKLVSGNYGACNVTMNMNSVYSVADVESITIVYSLNVVNGNGWAETMLTINGQYIKKMGYVAHDEWGMNAPQTQERTLTITKAELLAAGLTETDVLTSFAFSQTDNGMGTVTIKNITVA